MEALETVPVHSKSQITMLMNESAAGKKGTINIGGFSYYMTIYLDWSAGCTGGVVEIESANITTYAGTWAHLATVNWSAAGKQDIIQIVGTIGAIQLRISTQIANGTVNASLVVA